MWERKYGYLAVARVVAFTKSVKATTLATAK